MLCPAFSGNGRPWHSNYHGIRLLGRLPLVLARPASRVQVGRAFRGYFYVAPIEVSEFEEVDGAAG